MKIFLTTGLLLTTVYLLNISNVLAAEDLSNIASIKGQTDALEESFMAIETKFSTAVLSPQNTSAFTQTLSDIRQVKGRLHTTQAAIHKEISTLHSNLFIARMELEGYRVKAEKINTALNWVAHEILGFQAGISEPVHRLYAESIEIVVKLQTGKFEHLVKGAVEVQKELGSLLANLDNGTAPSTQEVEKIRAGLQAIIDDANSIKSAVALQYESVRETLEYQNTEISLAQKYTVERLIAEMGNLVHYTAHYRELIVKVLTTSF